MSRRRRSTCPCRPRFSISSSSSRPTSACPYLFISHDLGVVRYISDRIAVLYLGRLMELGPADVVFAGPHHPYTEALLSAVPTLDGSGRDRIKLQGERACRAAIGCVFHTRCRVRSAPCARRRAAAGRGRAGSRHALHIRWRSWGSAAAGYRSRREDPEPCSTRPVGRRGSRSLDLAEPLAGERSAFASARAVSVAPTTTPSTGTTQSSTVAGRAGHEGQASSTRSGQA